MRRLALGALVCSVAVLASCGMQERQTRNRVTLMMQGWQNGGTSSSGHMQEAVCMWYQGSRFIADDVKLSRAADQFDDWRREKGLYGGIQSWEIVSISEDLEAPFPTMDVAVQINGKDYRLLVASDAPIEWGS